MEKQSKTSPRSSIGIVVRAERVEDIGDGKFIVVVPARHLDSTEQEVLTNLFPNLREQAHALLNKEAILQIIVSEG